MKNMTKILIATVLLTVQLMVTGFEEHIRGRTQIESLYPIVVGGIDKGNTKGSEFILTTVSPSTEEDAEKPNSIMAVSGRTVFEANRRAGSYAENDIFWGHTKYVLIGHDAGNEDVFKYLEFFIRDSEPRMTIIPIYVNNYSSQELIYKLYEQNVDIGQTITRIIENIPLFSYTSTLDLLEFISLTSESKDGYLPCLEFMPESRTLRIEQETEKVESEELEKVYKKGELSDDYVMNITGYALIKDGKVIDHLNYEEGRGLNWLLDKVVSSTIIVDYEGTKYNLEITAGKPKIETKIDEEDISAKVKITVDGDITEASNSTGVHFTKELIYRLQEKAREQIKQEVQNALDTIQKHNVDVIGLGEAFNRKYPVKWRKKYKNKWEEIFPDVPVEIDIEFRLEKSGKFTDSIILD